MHLPPCGVTWNRCYTETSVKGHFSQGTVHQLQRFHCNSHAKGCALSLSLSFSLSLSHTHIHTHIHETVLFLTYVQCTYIHAHTACKFTLTYSWRNWIYCAAFLHRWATPFDSFCVGQGANVLIAVYTCK